MGDLKRQRATIIKHELIEEGEQNLEGETTVMWNRMITCIISMVTKEVLGRVEREMTL